MSRFEVVRDTREKPAHGWWFSEDSRCEGTTVAKVDYGDYTIKGMEEILAIERKASTAEIATNIFEDRFERELEVLSTYKYAYILFEFSWEDVLKYPERSGIPAKRWSKLRFNGKLIMRKIHEIRMKHNVHIIACGSAEAAKQEAYRIMYYAHEIESKL